MFQSCDYSQQAADNTAMQSYVVLIRGINVGGKNKVPMKQLQKGLENSGFKEVKTYIASGNVIVDSSLSTSAIKQRIEDLLPKTFALDSESIKVLVLTYGQLRSVVNNKPTGFGDTPDTYHSDAIFLIDITSKEAFSVFDPREGVDRVWEGDGVIYSERVSALRTKSRLNKIIGTPFYQSMTIRSWNTTVKLLELMRLRITP